VLVPAVLQLDLGAEQTMLPTSNDDGCERQHTSTLGGEALLSRPLHAKALMSPTSVHPHSQEMDGMAEMLSSDQQDCLNSQPASAELETEVWSLVLTAALPAAFVVFETVFSLPKSCVSQLLSVKLLLVASRVCWPC
jgi:hypothetical protein